MLITTVWLGTIGFLDDYIKVFLKDKEGLAGKFKILGQIGLGLIVGLTLYFSDDVVVRESIPVNHTEEQVELMQIENGNGIKDYEVRDVKTTKTTIPFFKNNEADYAGLVKFLGEETSKKWAWVIFVIVVIFIITAVSNGANMTDGLDGLATGTSAIIGTTLGILAYVSGNIFFAEFDQCFRWNLGNGILVGVAALRNPQP